MAYVEFAYTKCIHFAISNSTFEIVYGFDPLTPLNLMPLPLDEYGSLDGECKVKMVKKLHEKVNYKTRILKNDGEREKYKERRNFDGYPESKKGK